MQRMGDRFHCKQEPRNKTNHISMKEDKIEAYLLLNALAGGRVQSQNCNHHHGACSGPLPIHLHGAKPVQRRSETGDAGDSPREHALSRGEGPEVLHQGKDTGRRGEALFQGLSQCNLIWAWSMSFFFWTSEMKRQFIAHSLTGRWRDLREVNSQFIQVYGHAAIILTPATRECFTLAAISFVTKTFWQSRKH